MEKIQELLKRAEDAVMHIEDAVSAARGHITIHRFMTLLVGVQFDVPDRRP